MDTDYKRNKNQTRGLLSLEASIALTIFIFLMLFMYSFLVIFEARNEVGHVLLTTADSLSLDAFANDTLGDDSSLQGILYDNLFSNHTESNGTFTDNSKWYENDNIEDAVKTRFISYLSGGDRDEADKILKSLNIVGGVDGLDFSASCVSNDELKLDVKYEIEYEFQVFGLDNLTFSQSCCSKLWK